MTYLRKKSVFGGDSALGRARLSFRALRYLLWSARARDVYGLQAAMSCLVSLVVDTIRDVCSSRKAVECNLCGWEGARFYTNVGPGYNERNEVCPRCLSIRRYRSLASLLDAYTRFFSPDTSVIEVGPTRAFQAYCLRRKGHQNYRSFDLENFAMEQGDVTAMRYGNAACDYFLCLHVLEYVQADDLACREIHRVLKAGAVAILQVPIDYGIRETVEYGRPNAAETGHVRRYSAEGWTERLLGAGFSIRKVSVDEILPASAVERHGLDTEPFYLATARA